ncbi:PX domain-containing protein [Sporobolomyces koalae]|uniref:PX domain-containing protein n=1 Tax=Sporobolomyces koalae TaxID=500713 RepID=UPI003181093C
MVQQSTTSESLLPPFVPFASLSATFQTTTSPFDDFSTLPSRSPSPSPFSTPTPSALASPLPSPTVPTPGAPSSTFFGRYRSNSLHNSVHPSASSSSRRLRECSPPPVPSISSTPRNSRVISAASCRLSPPSARVAQSVDAEATSAVPLIKSVTVPHHSKSGKNWLFACRVVPVQAVSEGKGKTNAYGLGKMEMANDHEPYTVYRSWSECVEFATRLVQTFPDDRQAASVSAHDLFNHQVPRLSRKLVLFMTRSILDQRQAELDLFCRRLFQMPSDVRNSSIVRSFFGLRHETSRGSTLDLTVLKEALPPLPITPIDGEFDYDATIKPVKPKPRRPVLAVKVSTPNLRSAAKVFEDGTDAFLSPDVSRSLAASRAFTTDGADLRLPSQSSMASHSSSATVTPALFAAQNPPLSATASSLVPPESKFKTLRKKASGPLRHFRSLQDLRGASPTLEVPDTPVPFLSAGPMLRMASQPAPRTAPAPLALGGSVRPSMGSGSASFRPSHRRNGSSSSSISVDLWGTSQATAFRQTPTGRLESVPLQTSQRSVSTSSHRRALGGSISTQQASCGHSSSASISSFESIRSSSRSFDESGSALGARSARNSFDWGSVADGFATPPTPQSPWVQTTQKDYAFAHYNMVPPPPFFPVPPAMTSAYSHDGLAHAPLRLRTDSSASRRFDTISASPSTTSSAGFSSPGLTDADARSKWTFKLLHTTENVVLRIAKEDLTLERLRHDTRIKFQAAGVELASEDAHWGLSYTCKSATLDDNGPTSRLIFTQADLEDCLVGSLGKITFRIVT